MKFKILKILKEKKDFVSEEEICKVLNISKIDVFENISKLEELGYDIQFVSNKGYFINDKKDILNEFEISSSLTTNSFGKNFVFLKEIDSTNEEAKRQGEKGAENSFLVVSETQTKGKGRQGNCWLNSDYNNLAFSLLLKPNLSPENSIAVTLISGLAVCRAFRKLGIPAFLKWPNDLILNNKKCVGILTEMSCEVEKINYIVVGIGININSEHFDKEISKKATSIYIETGKKFKRAEILNCVLTEFEKVYSKFLDFGDFSKFCDEYKNLCLNIGKKVKTVSKKNSVFGKVVGISNKGELIVENDSGKVSVVSGEVSVRLQNGDYI